MLIEFFMRKSVLFSTIALLVAGALWLLFSVASHQPETKVTAVVETGTVQQIVSVSGVARSENNASLAFQAPGTLIELLVRKGDEVESGALLARVDSRNLEAEAAAARAALARAAATRNELISGLTPEDRLSLEAKIKLKEEVLSQIKDTESRKVDNARRILLSADLSAYSDKDDESAQAPQISGTYSCLKEGRYTLTVYRSNTTSGYSFTLSGLETGTFPASVDQAIPFGQCGLMAQFNPASSYGNTIWYIDIPNKKAASYTANKNAYELAEAQAKSAIALAEQELVLAQSETTSALAPARTEALERASATVAEAQANLSRITTEISKRELRAPFAGTITNTLALPGESVGTSPIITLLGKDNFELVARIPEIDIGRLAVGQAATAIFDARPDETLTAVIDYIAPNETVVDGVAYYEARLRLNNVPTWLRSGLNADIEIIIAERKNTLRIPTRFVRQVQGGQPTVVLQTNTGLATSTVNVDLFGNDGFTAISGLKAGDIVVAD